MMFLAKLIPRILHNVNRVCYIFGDAVKYPVQDITHTLLTQNVIAQIRQADSIVNRVTHWLLSTKMSQNAQNVFFF